MANADVAKIDLTVRIVGTVRMKKGKFKYYIHSDDYGPQFWNTREGQELLLASMGEIESDQVPGQTSDDNSEKPISIDSNEPEKKETTESWFL